VSNLFFKHTIKPKSYFSAVPKAQNEHTYPNVILPMHTFLTAMKVMSISRAVVRQPEFGAMLAEEYKKWEATPPYGSVD